MERAENINHMDRIQSHGSGAKQKWTLPPPPPPRRCSDLSSELSDSSARPALLVVVLGVSKCRYFHPFRDGTESFLQRATIALKGKVLFNPTTGWTPSCLFMHREISDEMAAHRRWWPEEGDWMLMVMT